MNNIDKKFRRVEDIMDSMSDALEFYGSDHCRKCRADLEQILTQWDDNPKALDRELVDFSHRLRLRKLQQNCYNCHPPIYKELTPQDL